MKPYSIWISKHISYIHVIDKLLSIMSALREVLNCVMEQSTLESKSINDDRQLKTRTPANFIVRLFYSAHITGVLNKFIFLVQSEWVLVCFWKNCHELEKKYQNTSPIWTYFCWKKPYSVEQSIYEITSPNLDLSSPGRSDACNFEPCLGYWL